MEDNALSNPLFEIAVSPAPKSHRIRLQMIQLDRDKDYEKIDSKQQ